MEECVACVERDKVSDKLSGRLSDRATYFAPLSSRKKSTSLDVSCGESGIGMIPAAMLPKKVRA